MTLLENLVHASKMLFYLMLNLFGVAIAAGLLISIAIFISLIYSKAKEVKAGKVKTDELPDEPTV